MARAARFKLVPPRIPEAALHQQIARILTIEIAAPGESSPQDVCWFSQDIANYGGTTPGLRTSRGVIAGVPDLVVHWRGRGHYVELKARDGRLSAEQKKVGASLAKAGCGFAVARSVEDLLAQLDAWEIPRAHRIRGL